MRSSRFHGTLRAHDIDIETGLPVFLAITGAQRACIGNQNIDAAQLPGGFLDKSFERRAISNIDARPACLHALGGKLAYCRIDLILIARADRDIAAFIRQRVRDRPPDTARAAQNHRPLAFKSQIHAVLPFFSDDWA